VPQSEASTADVPPDFGYVTDGAQKQAQAKLAQLVVGAKHVTNTNSGHAGRCHESGWSEPRCKEFINHFP
jgi:hypothetical protein